MFRYAYFACCLLCAPHVVFAETTPLKANLGAYESWHYNTYTDGSVRREVDLLTIKKQAKKYRNIKVDLVFVGNNGHTCDYSGEGSWEDWHHRLVVSDEENIKTEANDDRSCDEDAFSREQKFWLSQPCELVLIFNNNLVYVVTQNRKSCERYCGINNSIDGAVLHKVLIMRHRKSLRKYDTHRLGHHPLDVSRKK